MHASLSLVNDSFGLRQVLHESPELKKTRNTSCATWNVPHVDHYTRRPYNLALLLTLALPSHVVQPQTAGQRRSFLLLPNKRTGTKNTTGQQQIIIIKKRRTLTATKTGELPNDRQQRGKTAKQRNRGEWVDC